MSDTQQKLFGIFPPVETSEWENRILEDLKGADYRKKLVWNTAEGFDLMPYYREEHTRNIASADALPGSYPFVRGNDAASNDWEIRQDIETDELTEANRLAKDAISRGANGIGLVAADLETVQDLEELLRDICPSQTALHFGAAPSYPALARMLTAYCTAQNLPAERMKGSLDFDPLSYLLLNGDFWKSEKADLGEVATMIKLGKEHLPAMNVISVNGHYFNSAGATLSQELGFSLAMGAEYLSLATEAGLSADDAAQRMMFSFGIGSDYFPEIARLRAARLLWAKIVEQFRPAEEASMKMHIHCNASSSNKTLYDPYVNLLRSTTEAMSAILGGTQSLSILPFDTFFKDPDEFSTRLSRNQQIILKEEAYLDKVVDPAAGSYYIENLTRLIAEAAWKIFLEVQEKGGMTAAIKAGFVQEQVEASAAKKLDDIANRRRILLGTNQYPNPEEAMLEKIHFSEEEEMLEEELYADEETETEDDDDSPSTYRKLTLFGLSDGFDQLRLATEQYVSEGNPRPNVFLLSYGNLTMRKARAMFASNFFGCAGYAITDQPGSGDVNENIQAALDSGAEIVVLCSSDEEYASEAAGILSRLRKQNEELILVVAGYPKDILETLKSAGASEFIHVRSNLLGTLESFQEQLGIF
jgi:methylmalonyl-CoA mutase